MSVCDTALFAHMISGWDLQDFKALVPQISHDWLNKSNELIWPNVIKKVLEVISCHGEAPWRQETAPQYVVD